MKKVILLLAGAALMGSALAQVAVYRSGPSQNSATNSFGAVGYDPATGDLRERGDTITLAAGTPRVITEVSLYYLWATGMVMGDEGFRVRFYSLDGPIVTIPGGSPANAPGTLIWDSGRVVPTPGHGMKRVAVPNVTVPDTFACVWQAIGVTQTYDPSPPDQWDAFGASWFGPPQIGTTPNNGSNWAWRRDHPTDPWSAQDLSASGVANHADFGFNLWAGSPTTTPYDNTMNQELNAFTAQTLEYGDDVNLEGTNRTINGVTIEYVSDFSAPNGDENVIVRIYRRMTSGTTQTGQVQGAPEAAPLWQSAATPIDTSAGSHMLTIAVPNVTVPDQVIVTTEFLGQSGIAGDQAGLHIRTPAEPGGSNTRFWLNDGSNPAQNGWEGNFAFGVAYPTDPVANFSIKLSAAAGGGTQTLTATSVSFTPGIIVSGTVQNLNASDDQYLVVRPGIVFSTQQDPLVMNASFTAPQGSATQIQFRHEARANQANIRQTMYAFNFNTMTYDQLDQRNLPTTDTVVTVNLSPTSNYIGPGNEIRTRVNYRTVGPVFSYPWLVSMDQSVILFTP